MDHDLFDGEFDLSWLDGLGQPQGQAKLAWPAAAAGLSGAEAPISLQHVGGAPAPYPHPAHHHYTLLMQQQLRQQQQLQAAGAPLPQAPGDTGSPDSVQQPSRVPSPSPSAQCPPACPAAGDGAAAAGAAAGARPWGAPLQQPAVCASQHQGPPQQQQQGQHHSQSSNTSSRERQEPWAQPPLQQHPQHHHQQLSHQQSYPPANAGLPPQLPGWYQQQQQAQQQQHQQAAAAHAAAQLRPEPAHPASCAAPAGSQPQGASGDGGTDGDNRQQRLKLLMRYCQLRMLTERQQQEQQAAGAAAAGPHGVPEQRGHSTLADPGWGMEGPQGLPRSYDTGALPNPAQQHPQHPQQQSPGLAAALRLAGSGAGTLHASAQVQQPPAALAEGADREQPSRQLSAERYYKQWKLDLARQAQQAQQAAQPLARHAQAGAGALLPPIAEEGLLGPLGSMQPSQPHPHAHSRLQQHPQQPQQQPWAPPPALPSHLAALAAAVGPRAELAAGSSAAAAGSEGQPHRAHEPLGPPRAHAQAATGRDEPAAMIADPAGSATLAPLAVAAAARAGGGAGSAAAREPGSARAAPCGGRGQGQQQQQQQLPSKSGAGDSEDDEDRGSHSPKARRMAADPSDAAQRRREAARRTRKRKAEYISGLEQQNKSLKSEVSRLQRVLYAWASQGFVTPDQALDFLSSAAPPRQTSDGGASLDASTVRLPI